MFFGKWNTDGGFRGAQTPGHRSIQSTLRYAEAPGPVARLTQRR
jgi:hypothetical protein